MKLTKKQQDDILKQIIEDHEIKMDRYTKYTHEELDEFEKKGIGGDICRCQAVICNTMTVECVICGKIQPRFAKNYLRRNKE